MAVVNSPSFPHSPRNNPAPLLIPPWPQHKGVQFHTHSLLFSTIRLSLPRTWRRSCFAISNYKKANENVINTEKLGKKKRSYSAMIYANLQTHHAPVTHSFKSTQVKPKASWLCSQHRMVPHAISDLKYFWNALSAELFSLCLRLRDW